jgi:hypothetical protein
MLGLLCFFNSLNIRKFLAGYDQALEIYQLNSLATFYCTTVYTMYNTLLDFNLLVSSDTMDIYIQTIKVYFINNYWYVFEI